MMGMIAAVVKYIYAYPGVRNTSKNSLPISAPNRVLLEKRSCFFLLWGIRTEKFECVTPMNIARTMKNPAKNAPASSAARIPMFLPISRPSIRFANKLAG